MKSRNLPCVAGVGLEHTMCFFSLVPHQPNVIGRKTTVWSGLPNIHPARPATRPKFKALCPGRCPHTSAVQQVWKPCGDGFQALFVAFTPFPFRMFSTLRGNKQQQFSHQDACRRKKGHFGVIRRAVQLSLSVNWHKEAHLVVLQGGSGETASEKMLSNFLPLCVSLVTVTVALTHSLLVAEPGYVFQ